MALVAAACGDDDAAEPSATDAVEEEVPDGEEVPDVEVDRSAHFRFAMTLGFNSLDPHRSPAAYGDSAFIRPVYDSLLALEEDEDGTIVLEPRLATSFEVAEDGLSISFELRDDVTFQDGTPFDAEAVRANIERALDPDSTVASDIQSIERVEVVDDYRVVFHLNAVDSSVPWALAFSTPGMMVSPAAFDTDLASMPVGSGPYKLVSAQKDADVVLERWDGHWDPDAALAERITISTVADGNARLNGVRTGRFDTAMLGAPLDRAPGTLALEDEGYHHHAKLGSHAIGVLMHLERPPLDDVRVRRAISMAIDRDEISEELLEGLNPPVYQTYDKGFVGYVESLDADPYDPEEARRLVQEAGADGVTLNVIQQLSPPNDSIAEVVQQALDDIGLNVELTPLSPTEARPAWETGGHEAMVAAITRSPDPLQTLQRSYLSFNMIATPPDELVDLAETAQTLPPGSEEWEQAFQEINRYIVENAIHTPIARFATTILAAPDVVGSEQLVVHDVGLLDFRGVGIVK